MHLRAISSVTAVVALLGVGLGAGCLAEDSVDAVCHERGRTPAVLAGNGAPTAITLAVSCEVDLALAHWNLYAPQGSVGAPSESAVLTADRAQGRAFALTGTFAPQAYVRLDAVEVSATRDDGVHDTLIVVDWSVAP